jgi:hypothetical protein
MVRQYLDRLVAAHKAQQAAATATGQGAVQRVSTTKPVRR